MTTFVRWSSEEQFSDVLFRMLVRSLSSLSEHEILLGTQRPPPGREGTTESLGGRSTTMQRAVFSLLFSKSSDWTLTRWRCDFFRIRPASFDQTLLSRFREGFRLNRLQETSLPPPPVETRGGESTSSLLEEEDRPLPVVLDDAVFLAFRSSVSTAELVGWTWTRRFAVAGDFDTDKPMIWSTRNNTQRHARFQDSLWYAIFRPLMQ